MVSTQLLFSRRVPYPRLSQSTHFIHSWCFMCKSDVLANSIYLTKYHLSTSCKLSCQNFNPWGISIVSSCHWPNTFSLWYSRFSQLTNWTNETRNPHYYVIWNTWTSSFSLSSFSPSSFSLSSFFLSSLSPSTQYYFSLNSRQEKTLMWKFEFLLSSRPLPISILPPLLNCPARHTQDD